MPDAKMGIWCCQNWCYVDASCPSAIPASVAGFYWSYAACAESPTLLRSCPWKKPIGWQGSPVTLSDGARHVLSRAELEATTATKKKEEEQTFPPWMRPNADAKSNLLWIAITSSGFFLLILCLVCCLCCKRSSSDDDESEAVAANSELVTPTPDPQAKATASVKPKAKPKGRVQRAGFEPT